MILSCSFLFLPGVTSLNLTFLVNTRCIFADRGKYQGKRQKTIPLLRFLLVPLSRTYTVSIWGKYVMYGHDQAIIRCQKIINRGLLCKVQYSERVSEISGYIILGNNLVSIELFERRNGSRRNID